ncbi:MAG: Ig-like domain-containing protein, partial [Pseudomonadota bacterium]
MLGAVLCLGGIAACSDGPTPLPDAAIDAVGDGGGQFGVIFVKPKQDEEVSGQVEIELAVTGGSDVGVLVEISVDELPLAVFTAPPYQTVWDSTLFPEGQYSIRADASRTGGESSSETIQVWVVPPST